MNIYTLKNKQINKVIETLGDTRMKHEKTKQMENMGKK